MKTRQHFWLLQRLITNLARQFSSILNGALHQVALIIGVTLRCCSKSFFFRCHYSAEHIEHENCYILPPPYYCLSLSICLSIFFSFPPYKLSYFCAWLTGISFLFPDGNSAMISKNCYILSSVSSPVSVFVCVLYLLFIFSFLFVWTSESHSHCLWFMQAFRCLKMADNKWPDKIWQSYL